MVDYYTFFSEATKNLGEITLIDSPTGSGKSLIFPSLLAKNDANARIFISVPTIVAARSLSRQQSLNNPNLKVGFAAEGEIRYTKRDRIIYVTSGHLKKKMLCYFKGGNISNLGFNFTDYLILDEIHTGSLDNYEIMKFLDRGIRSGIELPIIILSTATFSQDVIAPLLEYDITHLRPESTESGYSKIIEYHNQDYDNNYVYADAASIVDKYHNEVELEFSFIVFVPGKEEISEVIKKLHGSKNEYFILKAFSGAPREELDLINRDPPDGRRKIIIGTNVLESAITVEGAYLVVDTIREKVKDVTETGTTSLRTVFESKASADQRAGRVGRTNDGVVYRMCTREFYENLDESRKEEVYRLPLYTPSLEVMKIGLDPLQFFDVVGVRKINGVSDLLQKLKMTTSEYIQDKGYFATLFDINIRAVSFLRDWIYNPLALPIFPGIVIAVILDSSFPPLYYIGGGEKGAKNVNTLNRFRGTNDLETYLNIWNIMTHELNGFNWSENKTGKLSSAMKGFIKDWNRNNSMNNKQMMTVIRNISRIYSKLSNMKKEIIGTDRMRIAPFNPIAAIKYAKNMIYNAYSDRVFKIDKNGNYDGHRLDGKNINRLKVENPEEIIGIEMINLGGRTKITFAINFDYDYKKEIVYRSKNRTEKSEFILGLTTNPVCELDFPNIDVRGFSPNNFQKLCAMENNSTFKHYDVKIDDKMFKEEYKHNFHLRQKFMMNRDLNISDRKIGKINYLLDMSDISNREGYTTYKNLSKSKLGEMNPEEIMEYAKSIHLGIPDGVDLINYISLRKKFDRTTLHWEERKNVISDLEFLVEFEDLENIVYFGKPYGYTYNYKNYFLDTLSFGKNFEIFQNFENPDENYLNNLDMSKTGFIFYPENRSFIQNFEQKIEKQLEFGQKYKPKVSMCRFIIPHKAEIKEIKFFNGEYRVPPWNDHNNYETRVIVQNYNSIIKINANNYRNRMEEFNTRDRTIYHEHDINNSVHDHCFDCAREIDILTRLMSDFTDPGPHNDFVTSQASIIDQLFDYEGKYLSVRLI